MSIKTPSTITHHDVEYEWRCYDGDGQVLHTASEANAHFFHESRREEVHTPRCGWFLVVRVTGANH